ncbi:MAG: sigma-54 dependent transcriptional regulator [Lentisphaeria bacterium]|nr:sigma-54 dependent transcriptional regulator [Lentisphaeria bacterium]
MSASRHDILIVDDEASLQYAFGRFFEEAGWAVTAATSGRKALKALAADSFDCLFLDVRLPDADGLDLIPRIRQLAPDLPIVIMTAYGSLETAVRAMDSGIVEYLVKPVDLDRALAVAEACLPRESVPAAEPGGGGDFVGKSPLMQEVFRRVGMFAQSAETVLITGETGTGKEMVARALHACGKRKEKPLVAVNCGALPDQLVESELFGFVKGAFTGADRDRKGRFEAAHGGTLFLDEIGELPLPAQVKLLRFLDTRQVEKLGSVESIFVDTRVVAATNRDLSQAVKKGTFREDLFFRLAVTRVQLPPLRERREDIPLLAGIFLAAGGQAPPPVLSPAALDILTAYDWPGNVRELKNVIQHALILARGGVVLPSHLPLETFSSPARSGDSDWAFHLKEYIDHLDFIPGQAMTQAIEPVEKALIKRALDQCHGNRSTAAEFLGIHRNTLRNKMGY